MTSNSSTINGSVMSYWLKFCIDAGIPASDAINYANIFSDHRIQESMLMDLTKEILGDMGFTIMGDIIAILKHSKLIHDKKSTEISLKQAAVENSSSRPKRSTAASRIVEHYIGKDPDARPMNEPIKVTLSADLAARLGQLPSTTCDSPARSDSGSVFERLGIAGERASTGSPNSSSRVSATSKHVSPARRKPLRGRVLSCDTSSEGRFAASVLKKAGFNKKCPDKTAQTDTLQRLGGRVTLKRPAATSEQTELQEGALPYAGVLKTLSRTPTKRAKASDFMKHSTLASDEIDGAPSSSTKQTSASPKKRILQRLGTKPTLPSTDST